MVELSPTEDDARVASLEQLIRDERDRFAAEQAESAAAMGELAERITILTGHNAELEVENERLRKTVAELKHYRKQVQRITKSPLYRPIELARKLAGRLRGAPNHR